MTAPPARMQIVGLGVDAYLKMLLIDNFVHTDLHPGNIFVRARTETQVRPRSVSPKRMACFPELMLCSAGPCHLC